MPSPRLLTNLSVLIAVMATVVSVSLVLLQPYTGFSLKKLPGSDFLVITKIAPWAADQGLSLGDQITRISSPNGLQVDLRGKHVPKTASEAGNYYDSREVRIAELSRINKVLRQPFVYLTLGDGRQVKFILNKIRPLSSLSMEVWVRFFSGLSAWLMGALVWVWRPEKKEAIFLMLSGLGLFVLMVPAAFSIYTMDMYYAYPTMLWFFSATVGIGDFLFIGFGTCVLLYFPQPLKNSGIWLRRLLWSLFLYASYALFNDWDLSQPFWQQNLSYTYNETYFPMPIYFAATLVCCFLQIRKSKNQPVERAQALWITLAWTIGPSIFFVFFLLPVLFGSTPGLSQTWTTLALLSTYWMVLFGLVRFKLLQLEQHIGTIYQWVLVSLIFFALDVLLVSMVNLNPQLSKVIIFCLVLWCYLPLRQMIYERFSRIQRRRYQGLFNDVVVEMVEGSLTSNQSPANAWQGALDSIFAPLDAKPLPIPNLTEVDKRGQQLNVKANRFSSGMGLEFAENGTRLFTEEDGKLADTLALLFVRLYKFRDAYFSGQTQERERIRRDLHDQIGNKLLSLIYSAKDDETRQLAEDTMQQLQELIRALKDEPVALTSVVADLKHLCEENCHHVNLDLHWQDSLSLNDHRVSSNQHLNLLNIVRELLNNAIKHSGASRIDIKVNQIVLNKTSELKITVSDNGVGFDAEQIAPGNGLYNIEYRAREINATIQWETSHGTEVVISLPLVSAKPLEVANGFS